MDDPNVATLMARISLALDNGNPARLFPALEALEEVRARLERLVEWREMAMGLTGANGPQDDRDLRTNIIMCYRPGTEAHAERIYDRATEDAQWWHETRHDEEQARAKTETGEARRMAEESALAHAVAAQELTEWLRAGAHRPSGDTYCDEAEGLTETSFKAIVERVGAMEGSTEP